MASQVAIANRALTKLGEARIISLDADMKAANVLKSMYDIVLAAELRAHWWHFAKARATLPALADTPDFDFGFQYQLPSDYVALRQIGPHQILPRMPGGIYSIERGKILTNLGAPLRIIYTQRITDPNLFDALFVEMFACRLAAESCESITQSSTKKQAAWEEYDAQLKLAIRSNAIELPTEDIPDDTWLQARR